MGYGSRALGNYEAQARRATIANRNSTRKFGSKGAVKRAILSRIVRDARAGRSGTRAEARVEIRKYVKGTPLARKSVRKIAALSRKLKGGGGVRRDSKGRFA